MGFNQSLDPWKLTAKNNTRDMKINRRENFWLLFHFPVWHVIRQLIEVSFQLYYKWKSKITGLLSTQDPWNSETASSLKKYFFKIITVLIFVVFVSETKTTTLKKKSLKASLKTSSANLLIKKRRRCESQSDTLFFSLSEISTHALIFLKTRMIPLQTLKLVELMTHSIFGEQHFSERALPTLFLRGEQPSNRVLMAKA